MRQIVTNFGKGLIASAVGGGGIKFTKVVISNAIDVNADGVITSASGDDAWLESIQLNEGNETLFGESGSAFICLPAQFSNAELAKGFRNTAAIIFAMNANASTDENTDDVYAACLIDEEEADYIPAGKDRQVDILMNYYVYVGEAESVTALISDSFNFVTKDVFNKHTHTAAGVGAADANHKHPASDINSGVLSVECGGTGVKSINDLRNEIMHFGTYIGNGESERLIDLGVKPKFVFVWCFSDDTTGSFGIAMEDVTGAVINQSVSGTGYTDPNSYSYHHTTVAIVDTGFKVSNCSGSGHSRTNVNGYKYGYMYY